MENKTAVEWLKEQLESIARTSVEWHEVFYEAIELEKQQITKAVNETQVRCIKTANSILKKDSEWMTCSSLTLIWQSSTIKITTKNIKNEKEIQNNNC